MSLLETILGDMEGLSKSRLAFMRWIFGAWLALPVRRTFLNLARFGSYCDKTIRVHFAGKFDFARFNSALIQKSGKDQNKAERVAAFDPSFIAKAGKHLDGVDSWWCGTLQKVQRGLELGVLGVIDVEARSALSLQATQTPAMEQLRAQESDLMGHYLCLVEEQKEELESLGVRVVTADAYFGKKRWVAGIKEMGLVAVTRLRQDANLNYGYHGPQKARGRHKKYAGKVDCKKIDKRRLRLFACDERARYYSGVVYAVSLECWVRIVYIEELKGRKGDKGRKGEKGNCQVHRYRILMSSDVELSPAKIVEYYQLRFQIEFLIRDAKTHAGLEECQARDKEKPHFHFNMALSAVSWAKASFWLASEPAQRGAFSLHNIRLLFTGELWTQRVFQNLGFDLSLDKYSHAYTRCLDVEGIAI